MVRMKNGLILAGLGCLLLCGAVVWLLHDRANPPAPPPVSASVQGNDAKAVDRTEAPVREPSQAQRSSPATPPAPAAPVPAQPRLGGPTPPAAVFMAFPNAGEADFKLKYEGLDLSALTKAKQALQQQLSDEFKRLADARFAQGLYEERILDPRNPTSDVKEVKPPEGVGQVRAAQQTELQPDGTMKNKTAWLSQAEQPEYFSHQSEYDFVCKAWKQAGGH
jgi:hypothetical protein